MRGLEHGGWATIITARSAIEARVLVTERVPALRPGRQGGPPDRPAVPLGTQRPGPRGRGQRPVPDRRSTRTRTSRRARPSRPTSGRAGDRAARPCSSSWPSTAPGPASPYEPYREPEHATGHPPPGLSGYQPDPAGEQWHLDHPPRMGFFTDTSVCIGCKACEVACKEWNAVPNDGLAFTGMSYDNTAQLGANRWRHVAFVEQPRRARSCSACRTPGPKRLPRPPPGRPAWPTWTSAG